MTRYCLRRLLVPLLPVLAVIILVLVPLAVVAQAITAVVRAVRGHRPRWRILRLYAFAAVYVTGECVCVLACLLIWLASPVPRWRNQERWRARHVKALGCFLGVLLRTAGLMFGFRITVENPRGRPVTPGRPLIVLGRHAGPGASFVLIYLLLRERGRVPMVVLKDQLRLDPTLDILLTRIGCAFIGRARPGAAGPAAVIAQLASQLHADDALVLFPEGRDWTPARHRLAVRRLHRKGLNAQAKAAATMPNVLPPRPAGTFAALHGAPQAQLAVFMHTGHDHLLDATSLWHALPLKQELHMVWWNEPRPEVTTEEECARWLNDVWARIDAWIQEQAGITEILQQKPAAP
ncbi:MAG TPA: 1-acyl-sn-glycerol-3-phosphate acyltransferase [Streptosporangiaceae bacterium]|jgi:1-acyl-sn-glycerol-3-phosphate acyltransferase